MISWRRYKVFIIFLLVTLKQLQLSAQEINRCATMEKIFHEIPENERMQNYMGFEKWMQGNLNKLIRKDTKDSQQEVYVVPVVVHVIHNGEPIGEGSNIPAAQVRSQIEVLNQDFRRFNGDRDNTPEVFKGVAADAQIEFRLALLGPDGSILDEPGIHRFDGEKEVWNDSQLDSDLKPITSWDPKLYMNIWVANLGNSLLGYASWPKASENIGVPFEPGSDSQDGVVINNVVFGSNFAGFGTFQKITDNRYDRGRTTTHEVGHFFGLLHPWGIVGGCNDDDFCEDTPTTITDRDDVFSPCTFPDPDSPNSCVEDEDDLPDMFQNFMDYTADACMNLFTMEQASRMSSTLENSPNRKDLLLSEVIPPHFAPSDLIITGNSIEGYKITWTDNSTNESAFIIERATDPFGDYQDIGFKPANSTDFDDLPGDGIYFYRVKAVNQSGETDYANPQATPNILPPTAPEMLQVLETNQDSVLLNWQNTSDIATSFEIFFALSTSTTFEKWEGDEISANTNIVWVNGLEPETSYQFRIRAVNAAGNSPFSETVEATTLPIPPNSPNNLSVNLNNDTGNFELQWDDNSDNELGFTIFRSTDGLSGFEEVGSVSENTADWSDLTISPAPFSVFYYRVSAFNNGGNSSFSNTAVYDGVTDFVDEPLENSLLVYPNPVESTVFVNAVLDEEQEAQLVIVDTNGRILLDTLIATTENVWFYSVDLSAYPTGIYFLRFITSKGTKTVKLLHL